MRCKRYFNCHLIWGFPGSLQGGHGATCPKTKSAWILQRQEKWRCRRGTDPQKPGPHTLKPYCLASIPQSCSCHFMTQKRGTWIPQEKLWESISFSLIMEAVSSLHGSSREQLFTIFQRATTYKNGGGNKREMAAESLPSAHPLKLASTISIKVEGKPASFDFLLSFSVHLAWDKVLTLFGCLIFLKMT